ncbi:MAG: outer membrane beta-barrel family protein [Candidatus Pedobacter colombiensis]|uniref:Outer membrane beta-barrel family protein n=1 Tax=Candidatus Pedobacter colombiensis TaxID=3121371 RepID=A0AAJ6B5U1_9SPHI|nr:outer membrane beta-barrel family protein [Pedobacter sp.]WEK19127.1 MAG: outer membrane beta-barrel family protein [Pedobacter sp.]
MKLIALIILFLSQALFASAQQAYSIKGSVIDTMASYKLVNTTITVLNQKDSTLVKFSRADAEGNFSTTILRPGKFILLVTYPGYADYAEDFTLDTEQAIKDFGSLNMILKSTLLNTVIINGKIAAIKIKGDTTEFNAGSFVVRPNARVEDLLQQLPGIQVDKDGKITAQGQTVTKVLVDGDEFFGDDPTLVTKNLRADMIDKVQLYDKKSDQAVFTGINDDKTEKTINLKLKEDKKKGYFGKIDAGMGTDDFYGLQGMFNIFKAKQKLSAYSTVGNTGKTGLNRNDSRKYNAGITVEFSDDGGMMINFGGGNDELESFDGRYNNEGIPLARTGGMHYDTKWNKDKQTINTNYKIGSLGVKGTKNTLTQNNLPDGILNSSSDQNFNNYIFRQKLDFSYFANLDSVSTLKISVDGTLKNSETNTMFNSNSTREGKGLLNSGERKLSNEGKDQLFNIGALYTLKLKKPRRTFSANMSYSLSKKISTGFLNSVNTFFNDTGGQDSVSKIDQYKTNDGINSVLNTNFTYTEPLSKSLSIVFNYGLGFNRGTSDRKSFNKGSTDRYDLLDTLYSNDYKLDQLTNQLGAVFNYRKNRTTINFGTKATSVRFNQYNVFRDQNFDRSFINWSPQASYAIKISQQASFRISYNGNNNQPQLNEIQPIRVNTDPLNITIGNKNLTPSFTNSFNLNYFSYKMLTEQDFSFYAFYSFTGSAIVSNMTTDAAAKNTYQAINLRGKMPSTFYFNFNGGRKIKPIDLRIGLGLGARGNTSYNYVNNALNEAKSYSFSGSLSVSKWDAKKYSFNVRITPGYNTSESSLQRQVNNNGWSLNSNGALTIYLPAKFQLSNDVNYEFTAATASFNDNFERTIWNAAIRRKFFKEENLSFEIKGNDLLNQNTGQNRSAWSNRIIQNTYTTIQRYFMFSVIWDFNKMGGSTNK